MIRIYKSDSEGNLTINTALPSAGKTIVKISDNLSSLTFQGSGDNTFKDQLVSVSKIGKRVYRLDDDCFLGAESLSSINLPDGLKEIGDRAFKGCVKLENCSAINYNKPQRNLRSIGEEAFAGTALKNVCADLSDVNYANSIGARAFAECRQLERVKLTNSILVDDEAFADCVKLKEVNLSESTGNFHTGVFSGCVSLPSISIPKGICSLSEQLFQGCTALAAVNIQDTDAKRSVMDHVENDVFNGCTSLLDLTLPRSINSLDKIAPYFLRGSSLSCVTFTGIDDASFGGSLSVAEPSQIVLSVTTSVQYQTGKWYGYKKGTYNNYSQILDYAKENHIPVFMLYCGDQCGRCKTWYKNVKDQADFNTWLASRPYFFFHSMWTDSSECIKDKFRAVSGMSCSSYGGPFGAWYWNKPSGKKLLYFRSNINAGFKYDGSTYYCGTVSGFTAFTDKLFNEGKEVIVQQQPQVQTTSERTTNVSGWGIGHRCYFISASGTKYIYDPEVSSGSVAYKGSYRTDHDTTSGFKYGIWYGKARNLKEFCDNNNVPCLVIAHDGALDVSLRFKNMVFKDPDFQSWIAGQPYMLCHVKEAISAFSIPGKESHFALYEWMDVNGSTLPSKSLPMLMWYWNKPGGAGVVKYCESYSSSDTPAAYITKIKSKCEEYFSSYTRNSAFNIPVSIEAEGSKYRKYENLTTEDDNYGKYFPCDKRTPIPANSHVAQNIKVTVTVKDAFGNSVTETFKSYFEDGQNKMKIVDASGVDVFTSSIPDATYQYFTGTALNYDRKGYIFKILDGKLAYLYSFTNDL